MQYRAIDVSERSVLFVRNGRAAKGEPSHVSRYYKYTTNNEAWRAFNTDKVGKGKPESTWRNSRY